MAVRNDPKEPQLLLTQQGHDEVPKPAAASIRRRRILLGLAGITFVLLLLAKATANLHGERARFGRDRELDDGARQLRRSPGGLAMDVPQPDLVAAKRDSSSSSAPPAMPTVLECFQVAEPVLMPYGASYQSSADNGSTVTTQITSEPVQPSCTVVLMEYSFGNSYGAPYVGAYTPPSCQFNRVVMNFTVVSEGRQFDRLALMYLNDTEVWRTSTAEPTVPPGIRWEYQKDMTEYLALWKTPQTVIFDLGNLINNVYTGYFNTTLTATFFMSDVDTGAPPSDLVIPISKRLGTASNSASAFNVPQDNATNTISFPRNANRAVFSVSACGQGNEEFWWGNVLLSDEYAFNSTAGFLPAYSPFREVQVLIDGQLAGVQWPFPVIFTGGVVPGLHRPIVGIDDFDLREHEIDITPFLPLLSDGKQHTFTIQVAGLNDNGKTCAKLLEPIEASWIVTGKIFVWLDDPTSITTGTPPVFQDAAPYVMVSQAITEDSSGVNETLTYSTYLRRSFSASAVVNSQNSNGSVVSWSQDLSYSNRGYIWAYGYDELTQFTLTGTDTLSGPVQYKTSYSYPLSCNSTLAISPQGNVTITADLAQGLDLRVVGASVFPSGLEAFEGGVPATKGTKYPGGSLLTTRLQGTAGFFQYGDGSVSSGYGTTTQVFRFGAEANAAEYGIGSDPDMELYYRDVTAVNGTVVSDNTRIAGATTADVSVPPPPVGAYGNAKGLFAHMPADGGRLGSRPFAGRLVGQLGEDGLRV